MSEVKAGQDGNGKQKRKGRIIFRLIVFLLIVLLTITCGFMSYRYVISTMNEKDKQAVSHIPQNEGIEVDVPLGASTSSIANMLKEKDIIRYPYVFKLISKLNGYDGEYKAGKHIVSKKLGYTEIMKALSANPLSDPSIRVTIREGLTYKETVDLLVKKDVVDRDSFNKISNNGEYGYDFIKKIPKRENRLEGYLFPDTYDFEIKKGNEKQVIDKMLKRFDQVFSEEDYKRAKELNMSIDDIIILASIIEREAGTAEERPIIAGVFYNRLKSKDSSMRRLQSCATIQYIFLNKQGVVKERILDEDTKIDDPYNTYMHEGLPPGPISNPGEDSIKAALYPEGDYLFFVTKEDGTRTHYFSKTYKEHLSAINKSNKNLKASSNKN